MRVTFVILVHLLAVRYQMLLLVHFEIIRSASTGSVSAQELKTVVVLMRIVLHVHLVLSVSIESADVQEQLWLVSCWIIIVLRVPKTPTVMKMSASAMEPIILVELLRIVLHAKQAHIV